MTENTGMTEIADETAPKSAWERAHEMTPEERVELVQRVERLANPDLGEEMTEDEIELALACIYVIQGSKLPKAGGHKERKGAKKAPKKSDEELLDELDI